jgi:hypothetical protein
MEPNVHLFPLQTLTDRQYNFQKVTQFSQRYNVLDISPSNINVILSRDAYVQFFPS